MYVPIREPENVGPEIVGLVRVLLVRVCVAVSVTTVSEVEGNVMVVPSVPARVSVFETERDLPEVTMSAKY